MKFKQAFTSYSVSRIIILSQIYEVFCTFFLFFGKLYDRKDKGLGLIYIGRRPIYGTNR
jgi:hypothetical protein